MAMKQQNLKGFEIDVPTSSAFNINTPKGLPKMHFIEVSVGKRGSGKTAGIVNQLKWLQDSKCLDRLFLVTPTYFSNKHFFYMVKYDPEDVYENPNKASLDSIIEKINVEAEEYEDYIEKMKQYKKYQKYLKTGRGFVDDDELSQLWNGTEIVPPKHKWDGRKPVMLILFDDCQNSPIYRPSSELANCVIRHRHLGQLRRSHGALGVSMIFAVQSYKSAGGGLPRCVRGQATIMMIFRTKDVHELDDIADECSGEVSVNTFKDVYEVAVSEPHSFLFIDFHKKDTDPSMFRMRFNKYLIPSEIEAEKRMKKISPNGKEANAGGGKANGGVVPIRKEPPAGT